MTFIFFSLNARIFCISELGLGKGDEGVDHVIVAKSFLRFLAIYLNLLSNSESEPTPDGNLLTRADEVAAQLTNRPRHTLKKRTGFEDANKKVRNGTEDGYSTKTPCGSLDARTI